MSTHRKDRLEKIQEIITDLSEESAKGKLIVVEGKKDAQALSELGVIGRVLTLKTSGKSTIEAINEIEALGNRKIILLLDFDRRGIDGTKFLQRELEHLRIKVNTKVWVTLKAIVNRDIQCIESLPSYLVTAQQKATSGK